MIRICRPMGNPIQITVASESRPLERPSPPFRTREVATHDYINAASTIAKVAARFPGSLLTSLCCALLLIGLPSRAAADKFTITLTPQAGDNRPFAAITATAMGPTVFNTTMLFDTGAGNGVGFAFDTNSLFAGFLVDGMVGRARGIGGIVVTINGATGPVINGFSPAPTIPNGQVATQPAFPMTFLQTPLPRPRQGTIGMDYVNTFASFAVNPNMGRPVSIVLDTTNRVSQARPSNADSEAAVYIPPSTFPDGSVNVNSNVFSVPIQVSSVGGTPVTADFVIDSGVENSLITSSLAAALGLNIGGLPSSIYSTDLGSFSAPFATLLFSLFPSDPNFMQLSSANVAIGDLTNDPAGINLLGSDILSQLSYWEIDPGISTGTSSTFAAAPVPEPASLTLVGVGLAGLAAHLLSRRSKPRVRPGCSR